MSERKVRYGRFLWALLVAGVCLLAWLTEPTTLKFKPDIIKELPTMFGYLVLISLFVERAIEVFLPAWRSAGADELDREITSINNRIADSIEASANKYVVAPPDRAKIERLKDECEALEMKRTRYKSNSRFTSRWLGLGIGVLVAFVGVRVLANIVDISALTGSQKGIFVVVDILLTGAVLAGGSEAINKIMKVYNSFMTSTADKAKPQ